MKKILSSSILPPVLMAKKDKYQVGTVTSKIIDDPTTTHKKIIYQLLPIQGNSPGFSPLRI
jgi:hypothetical protein